MYLGRGLGDAIRCGRDRLDGHLVVGARRRGGGRRGGHRGRRCRDVGLRRGAAIQARRLRHALGRGRERGRIVDLDELRVVRVELALVLGDALAHRLRLRLGARRIGGELLVELGAAGDDALLGLLRDPLRLGLLPLPDLGDVRLGPLAKLPAAPVGVTLEETNLLVRLGSQVGDAGVAGLVGHLPHCGDQVAHELVAGLPGCGSGGRGRTIVRSLGDGFGGLLGGCAGLLARDRWCFHLGRGLGRRGGRIVGCGLLGGGLVAGGRGRHRLILAAARDLSALGVHLGRPRKAEPRAALVGGHAVDLLLRAAARECVAAGPHPSAAQRQDRGAQSTVGRGTPVLPAPVATIGP